MRVLVTGAAGCLGTELALLLRARGDEVIGIDNCSRYHLLGESGPRAQKENVDALIGAGVYFIDCCFTDLHRSPAWREWSFAVPDAVVHAAAQVCHSRKDAREDPLEDVDVNIRGTVNLLELCRATEPRPPMLFISSSKVYGENFNDTWWADDLEYVQSQGIPEQCALGDQTHLTFFGASKAAADLFCQMYARQYGMTVGVFRPGCFTGRWALAAEAQNWLPWLVHCARTGRPFNLYGDGDQVRDLLHTRDLANACIKWLDAPSSDVWNIGGGPETAHTLKDAIARVERLTGKRIAVRPCPRRPGDIYRLVLDSSRYECDYHWRRALSLEDIYLEACA